MTESPVEIGRVLGPHGASGKVRVKVHSGNPAGLLGVRSLTLSAEGPDGEARCAEFAVRTAQPRGGFAVFSLEGIDSPDEARKWLGASASVSREELPRPEEGEYYWVDLIGCEVVGAAGDRIGEVAGLEEGPAHDWLSVRRADGEFLLPMVSEFIREVDIARRRVVAVPPEGW
jgi:16S rRNA processing protein RimM